MGKSSTVQKRKSKLPRLLKKMKEAGKQLGGVHLDKDPKKAKLEMEALGIAAILEQEGIQ